MVNRIPSSDPGEFLRVGDSANGRPADAGVRRNVVTGSRASANVAPPHARRMAPQFHTVKQVAEALGVCSRSVRRWIQSGDLPVHRFGGAVRVADADLRAFLATNREG
jgi:excisionase family DNA binding protein